MKHKSIRSFFAKATRYEVLDDKDKAKEGCFTAIRQRADQNNRDVARNFEPENAALIESGTEADEDQEIQEISAADSLQVGSFNDRNSSKK